MDVPFSVFRCARAVIVITDQLPLTAVWKLLKSA
jgi:hypothetical protein